MKSKNQKKPSARKNEKNNGHSTGEKKLSLADRFGDMIEKVGHKLAESGAPHLGRRLYTWGDRSEKNHTNSHRPHKT